MLVASLVLAGQLGVSAHLALVPHTVCAVHGELVHGELVHAASALEGHLAPKASLAPQTQPQVTARPAHSGHSDEHCSVLAHRREQAAPPARLEPFGEALAPAAILASAPSVTPRLEVPFRLAPKQSPPA